MLALHSGAAFGFSPPKMQPFPPYGTAMGHACPHGLPAEWGQALPCVESTAAAGWGGVKALSPGGDSPCPAPSPRGEGLLVPALHWHGVCMGAAEPCPLQAAGCTSCAPWGHRGVFRGSAHLTCVLPLGLLWARAPPAAPIHPHHGGTRAPPAPCPCGGDSGVPPAAGLAWPRPFPAAPQGVASLRHRGSFCIRCGLGAGLGPASPSSGLGVMAKHRAQPLHGSDTPWKCPTATAAVSRSVTAPCPCGLCW